MVTIPINRFDNCWNNVIYYCYQIDAETLLWHVGVRMKTWRRAIVLSLLATPVLGYAQTSPALGQRNPPASALVDACKDIDTPSLNGISCHGFVNGVVSGIAVGVITMGYAVGKTTADAKVKSLPIPCVPAGATNGEIVKVVLKYIDAHPESLHNSAASEIYMALIGAWGFDGPQCR
jgi:Rap1a immunity proteins